MAPANTYKGPRPGANLARMNLLCPSCGTRYQVDPAALSAGERKVRCARCRHVWVERQTEDLLMPADVAEATDAPEVQTGARIRPPVRERRRDVNWAGWAALVLIVGVVVGAGVLARERIVAAWPPAAKLYEMVRLPVQRAGAGLELHDVRSSKELDEGVEVLVVEGEIVNASRRVREVPRLRVAFRDGAGQEIEHWLISVAQARLQPGESAGFSVRWERPPPEAEGLAVRFEAAD